MREIKFRAWDKRTGEMYDVIEMGWRDGFGVRVGFIKNHLWGTRPRTEEEIILMQFTGLLDKNGKEIFEGDILERFDGLVAKGANPIVKQIVKWAEWHYEGIKGRKQSIIIGNIHENPELMEATP